MAPGAFRRAMIAASTAAAALLSACGDADAPEVDLEAEAMAAQWLAGLDLPALMDCVRERDASVLQAHRAGPRAGLPENALPTIEAALREGALFVELDVRTTADGVPVLMHDATLERTTTGAGAVAQTPLERLAELRLTDPAGEITEMAPPTLAQALDALDGTGFAMLDLKDVPLETLAGVIAQTGAQDRVITIAYTIEDAAAINAVLPGVMISVGVEAPEDLDTLAAAGIGRDRVLAWLGLGQDGEPALDAALAEAGVETSFGDFRAEASGRIDYLAMKDAGAEVLSVDDVVAAARALKAGQQARGVVASCPEARVAAP